MQINAINALNTILVHTSVLDQHAAPFLADRHVLLRAVSFLSDSRSSVRIHPKALLTCALLIRLGPEWLCTGVEAELLGRIEGTAGRAATANPPGGVVSSEGSDRELEEYTVQCRDTLLVSVGEGVAQLFDEVRPNHVCQGTFVLVLMLCSEQ